jgi:predicted ATP-dependent serine protease
MKRKEEHVCIGCGRLTAARSCICPVCARYDPMRPEPVDEMQLAEDIEDTEQKKRYESIQ